MINYQPIGVLHNSENGSLVLKVRDKNSREIYALKLIGPLKDQLKNLIFKREIGALRILNQYDDVVKIYDFVTGLRYGDQSNLGGILLEFVDGQTLDQVDLSSLSHLMKTDLCLKICKAIAKAHNNGILHRDIKPQNIMYQNGQIKIIDFGSSKIKSIVEKNTTMPLFSHYYSAPEVVAGGETSESSDIYSLGIVFAEILMGIEPSTTQEVIDNIQKVTHISILKELFIHMIQYDCKDRLSDITVAIRTLEQIIGHLNVSTFRYAFYVDSGKFNDLKRQYVIENNMTMVQFLNVYLKKEFENIFGYYDKTKALFKFVGNNIYMECFFEGSESFKVAKMYPIKIDRRIRMQKIFCKIEGSIEFTNSLGGTENNNLQLKVILNNHLNEITSYENKTRLFDDLFGKWKQSLIDSIDSVKNKNGRISYSDYTLDNGRLIVTLTNYENNSIDNVTNETKYIFEEKLNQKIITYIVGNYEDVILEENELKMVISLSPKVKLSKIRSFLDSNKEILEDYNYKINSFRRQIYAITCLKNDECTSKDFKDIILNLESPTSTKQIKSIQFYAQELNDSQKSAVNKAIFSDCISLIQGPPGTGKTKVINEILNQIVLKSNKTSEIPKILVVSQSNTAVDNVLEGLNLIKTSANVRIVRIGDKEKVSSVISSQYMVDAIRDEMFISLKERSKQFVSQKIELYSKTSEEDKWLKIQEIQEDWSKRCGDFESLNYHIINSATIIAGTCIGFLSNEFIRDFDFDYVIIDEAAKATTPELLVSIIKSKKIILVGDQNQLAPFVNQELSSLLFELVKDPQYRLFDILFNILPETHKQVLSTQYRMIRNIGDLISQVFYDGKIDTGIDNAKREHNIPFYKNKSIIWYNTSKLPNKGEKEPKGGSYNNPTENQIIKNILRRLNSLENASSLDIGIITGYRAQKNLIKKSVINSGFEHIGKIDVNTLDAFQGRENDVIIYSTVRTKRSIGFQKEKERTNVAFSRAKKLLIICGDIDFFYSWDDEDHKFPQIIDYIKEHSDECMIIDLPGEELDE